MKKKKKLETRKILLITLLVICLILGFIANVVSTDRNLTIFEKAIKDSVLTVQKVITYPVDFIIEKINISKEKNKMYEDYKELKKQLDVSKAHSKENEELRKQINELKTLLELNNSLIDYETINATVISRDLAYFNDYITVDKGEIDGIYKNMPVVVFDGLIGKVVKTSNFNSTIKLLTSTESNDKISVKIKNGDEYIYGILSKYDIDSNMYIIEGIAENIEIEKNSLVTTTGMGDIFPAGIVIGRVKGISSDNFDLSKVLEVQSDVNFDSINYVTLLKRGDV